jgi:hypothetical protein
MAASGYGGKGLSIATLTRGSGLGALLLGSALSAAAACPPAGLDKAGPELPGVTAALKTLDR